MTHGQCLRLAVFLSVAVACRANPQTTSKDVPPSDVRLDAAPSRVSCSERLAAVGGAFAAAPRDLRWREHWLAPPPVIHADTTPVGQRDSPLVMIRPYEVTLSGFGGAGDPFDGAAFTEMFIRRYRDMPASLIYVLVDERASLAVVRDVRVALAKAMDQVKRVHVLGLLFRRDPTRFPAYTPPMQLPIDVRTALAEMEGAPVPLTGLERKTLSRAAPDCPTAVEAAVQWMDYSYDVTDPGKAVLDALEVCDCSRLDLDAFAGLVLGAIGYRNPYGYVRLATSPRAKHRIKVPLTGSMADIAAAWPANAGDEAVWIDFE